MKELKFYSNINCQLNKDDISSIKASEYEKQIKHALEKYDQGSLERGLMKYFSNELLKQKIFYAHITVEKIGRELFGVFICSLKQSLNDQEIKILEKECLKLYSGEWGIGFKNMDIKIPNSVDILNLNFSFKSGDFFYQRQRHIEIETKEDLIKILKQNDVIERIAFQAVDFSSVELDFSSKTFNNCLFLGCNLPNRLLPQIKENCHVYPITNLPFCPFINTLYTKESLFNGYEIGNPSSYENCLDKKIYNHYIVNGKEANNIKETLFRRLHDHSITDALNDFIEIFNEKKLISVMGGHSLARGNKDYNEVAKISKKLTELGFLMISGGGPGAMEATHLGAWLAGKTEDDLNKCIQILSEAPSYKDELWFDKAFEVLKLFPTSNYESLGIPTWLYGHEPPTPFASKIAKYFANSVREDGLLTIAKGGVIFAPGNAGTIQEIFQDATQNHYLSFGYASPMIFLNDDYWSKERPIFPLLKKMTEEKKYENLIISSYDEGEDIIKELERFSS